MQYQFYDIILIFFLRKYRPPFKSTAGDFTSVNENVILCLQKRIILIKIPCLDMEMEARKCPNVLE